MYCPNCGQQQISDEMRFCSRCGLALTGLLEWLAGGGLPVKRSDQALVATNSPRRNGIRRAGKVMFASGVMFPVFLVLSLVIDHGELMIFPILVFFVSLVMMLYARLFSDKTSPVTNQAFETSYLGPGSGRQQVRTNELVQPASVTENTTRLLDNE